MSLILPYVNSTGQLKKLFQKIKEAQTPERFNYDYLNTELGISERAMVPLLKKLEFLNEDGTPSQLYRDFRNPDVSGVAMATAIKKAYKAIYSRNEFAHSLTREKLIKLIAEITGKDHDTKSTKTTYVTFDVLRGFANFIAEPESKAPFKDIEKDKQEKPNLSLPVQPRQPVGLNLGYTINLNLPETTNIEVYNAIFKSLNEHLLKNE